MSVQSVKAGVAFLLHARNTRHASKKMQVTVVAHGCDLDGIHGLIANHVTNGATCEQCLQQVARGSSILSPNVPMSCFRSASDHKATQSLPFSLSAVRINEQHLDYDFCRTGGHREFPGQRELYSTIPRQTHPMDLSAKRRGHGPHAPRGVACHPHPGTKTLSRRKGVKCGAAHSCQPPAHAPSSLRAIDGRASSTHAAQLGTNTRTEAFAGKTPWPGDNAMQRCPIVGNASAPVRCISRRKAQTAAASRYEGNAAALSGGPVTLAGWTKLHRHAAGHSPRLSLPRVLRHPHVSVRFASGFSKSCPPERRAADFAGQEGRLPQNLGQSCA